MASKTTKNTTAIKTTPETHTTTDTKTTPVVASDSVSNIEKTIQDHTPAFVSRSIIWTVDNLESFRINTFNKPFVFYPVLLIFVFFILRYIWSKIY